MSDTEIKTSFAFDAKTMADKEALEGKEDEKPPEEAVLSGEAGLIRKADDHAPDTGGFEETKTNGLSNPVRKTDDDVRKTNYDSEGLKGGLSNGANEASPEIEEMFRAGLHFGYSRTRRHPKMNPYIFGLRNNIEVFDLEKINVKLREAEELLKKLAYDGGTLLLVGSKPSASSLIEKIGQELGMPYSNGRWPGGLLTNFSILRKRLDYLEELKEKRISGDLAKYTKKEQADFNEEITRLEQKFAGLVSLRKRPDALLIIDPKEEKTATREAKRLGISVLGVMNIDIDPETVTYPIPANDSAHSSIKYILNRLSAAYKEGLTARVLKEENSTPNNA